jgi:hypothetical protein
MAEVTSNVELAHRIHEHGHGGGAQSRREERLEILEAVILASVAVLTAWSGYQAARWDAKSAESYARATSSTVQAQEQFTLAGQERLYDITTFGAWIEAKARGEENVAAIFEHRFRPEYRMAFAEWIKIDPLRNPNAPAGPIFMPEYRSARTEKARELTEAAGRHFDAGVADREKGDDYVRVTVLLATVLLLAALSQRFRVTAPRVGVLVVAVGLLGIALFWIATFPRA